MPSSLIGNDAVALAMKQINPDVVAAYPITPTTYIMEKFASYVADGLVDSELITTESEHSALSACIGASAAGARVMTATASQGLALMHEVLYVAAGMRLPIIIICGNRTLSAPLNIHCDHSDSLGSRDSGCIQLYSENVQEVYDNTIQAILIAENKKVLTPVIVCFDAFSTTHTLENIQVSDDQSVKKFIGEFKPSYDLLNIAKPVAMGNWTRPNYYFEAKRNQLEGIDNALQIIPEVGKKFQQQFGRPYDLVEEYLLDDAERVFISMGSSCGTIKQVINDLRAKKEKVGLLKIRSFRPFPAELIKTLLKNKKSIAVFDRQSPSGASGGPLFNEIRSALYEEKSIPMLNFIYGLGGRQLYEENIKEAYQMLLKPTKDQIRFLNLRE